MKNDPLQGIQEFLVVAEAGSFTAAAQQLGTTRSRVSQVIGQLELRLGVELIRRSTRTMLLTDIGEELYRQSSRGVRLIEQAIDQSREDQNSMVGKIRINSVGGVYGESLLSQAIIEFMAKYPEVSVELDFSSAHVDLFAEKYDLVIRGGELPDSNLVARPFANYRTYVCASPDYIERKGMPDHPRELNGHDVIVGSVRKWRFSHTEDSLQSFETVVDGRLFCPNGRVACMAAQQDLGIIRAPAYYVEKLINCGELLEVFPQWRIGSSKLSIVYTKSRYKVKRIQCLIDFLLTNADSINSVY